MKPVDIISGDRPLILAMPHAGTWVPEDIAVNLNETGRKLADTDWHIDRLYKGLCPDITIVKANFHRYVIDANRAPSGQSLYPGQNTTDLVPTTDFDGHDIWAIAPDALETKRRLQLYHKPYHQALSREIDRLRSRHGKVILYDCHSIRSNIPFLFEGTLPDFNIGSNDGKSCAQIIANSVLSVCEDATGYRTVLNGRFKGGWTTRHYGNPGANQHAIQMELAQSAYLHDEQAPWDISDTKVSRLRVHLGKILNNLADLAEKSGGI